MKRIYRIGASAVLSLIAASAVQAATLLADGSQYTTNDLTRVRDGGTVYEYLDFTATRGRSPDAARSAYAADGFALGGYQAVRRLLDVFDFVVPGLPSGSEPVGFSGGNVTAFISRLGDTYGNVSLANFDNGAGTTGYFCVSYGRCRYGNFIRNHALGPNKAVGYLMVREVPDRPVVASVAAPVPLPATVSLTLAGGWGAWPPCADFGAGR